MVWRVRHSGGLQQLDIQTFRDFSDDEISRRILMEDPVMRVVLVSMRAGQSLPEQAANGLVTVYSVGRRVLFYEGDECCDMVPAQSHFMLTLAVGRLQSSYQPRQSTRGRLEIGRAHV